MCCSLLYRPAQSHAVKTSVALSLQTGVETVVTGLHVDAPDYSVGIDRELIIMGCCLRRFSITALYLPR